MLKTPAHCAAPASLRENEDGRVSSSGQNQAKNPRIIAPLPGMKTNKLEAPSTNAIIVCIVSNAVIIRFSKTVLIATLTPQIKNNARPGASSAAIPSSG